MSNSTLRCFSFGGGVQSTAALVLSARGEIDFPVFLFANVGDDSEHPATLRYIKDVAAPYAAQHNIEIDETRRILRAGPRKGQSETLLQQMNNSRNVTIPIRLWPTGAPGQRACTVDHKIMRIDMALRERGATRTNRAILGLGISLDEYQRMSSDNPELVSTRVYPLIDLRLTRQDCINIIERAGLPVPPKSACWFCPFHSDTGWREMKKREPGLFAQAVKLELKINTQRAEDGKSPAFLSRSLVPLEDAVADDQATMFNDDDTCESGFCMT